MGTLAWAQARRRIEQRLTWSSDQQGQGGSEAQQRLALLALGSIGRTTDLSSYSDVQPVITGTASRARNPHLGIRRGLQRIGCKQALAVHLASKSTCVFHSTLFSRQL